MWFYACERLVRRLRSAGPCADDQGDRAELDDSVDSVCATLHRARIECTSDRQLRHEHEVQLNVRRCAVYVSSWCAMSVCLGVPTLSPRHSCTVFNFGSSGERSRDQRARSEFTNLRILQFN